MADVLLVVGPVVAGTVIVAWILWDVFQTVIVPRPTPTRVRFARFLTRGMWRIWRARAVRAGSSMAREKMLGSFAPLLVVVLLGAWVSFLILGYGLILFGLRSEILNEPDFVTAVYQAGITVLTIGYGDVLAQGILSRMTELLAAGTGLGVVALGITYLFSLYGSFQRREQLVTTLDARAGAPPSGVAMLETSVQLGLWDDLRRTFAEWEVWAAQVLDSHVAYPVLIYFRSSHDNESWLSALGAVLDAAVLIKTTVERGPGNEPLPTGQAIMTIRGGSHLVEDLGNLLGFATDGTPMVERGEYDAARERLRRAGLGLRADADASWAYFVKLRSEYATRLNRMASYLMTPPTQWIGDRSILPHRSADALPSPTAAPLRPATLPRFKAPAIEYLTDDADADAIALDGDLRRTPLDGDGRSLLLDAETTSMSTAESEPV